jgi:hypothetical protein
VSPDPGSALTEGVYRNGEPDIFVSTIYFDVPESYGVTAKFFRKMKSQDAFGYFVRFAKEKGMFFD